MSSLIQPEIFFSALRPAEERIQQALEDIRQGKPVLVMDDFDRENEADLIVAAETLTNETMARMIRDGSGIVCLCLTDELAGLTITTLKTEHQRYEQSVVASAGSSSSGSNNFSYCSTNSRWATKRLCTA